MTRSLSTDLRQRLVGAVDAGMSRRAAAERFGVATSTAIKLVEQMAAPTSPAAPSKNPLPTGSRPQMDLDSRNCYCFRPEGEVIWEILAKGI